MATVDGLWDAADQGDRSTLLIGGPPGVGKTRLAAEAAAAAESQGAHVLRGRCFSNRATPLQPFSEAFAGVVEAATDEDTQLVGHILNRSIEEDDLEVTRGKLALAMVAMLERLAADKPVVLVIDDLHWASAATLGLFSHLVRATKPRRMLTIATFRTTIPDRSDALTETVADLYRMPGVHRIDLSGLSVEEIVEFLGHRSSGPPADLLKAAAVLRDHTGGNPFFLTEVWNATGNVTTIASGQVAIPPTVNDALEARFRALGDSTTQVLQLAALFGTEIDADVVVEASALPPTSAANALDAAVGTGLIRATPTGHTFVHDLARKAIINAIPLAAVAGLHHDLAHSLLRRFGDAPAYAARIGAHLASGPREDAANAIEHLARGARYAASHLAFEEAAEHLQQASTLTADSDERDQLLLEAADNLVKAAWYSEAEHLYATVCTSSNPLHKARAAIGLEDTQWRPGWDASASAKALKEARAAVGDDASEALQVQLLASHARALSYSGRMAEAEQIGEEALLRARRIGDDRLLAIALLLPITMRHHVADTHLERASNASEIALSLDDIPLLKQAAFVRGSTAYALGRPAEWLAALSDLATCVKRSGEALAINGGQLAAACSSTAKGNLAEATRTLGELEPSGGGFGVQELRSLTATGLFLIHRETGLEDVRPLMTGNPATEPGSWPLGRLAIYTELGMTDPAKTLLKELLVPETIAFIADKYRGSHAAFLSDAVALVGTQEQAAVVYEALAPRSGTNLITGHFTSVFGSADRYLGILAAKMGKDASDHFEQALAMDDQMGAVLHHAETMARYAAYLQDRDADRSADLAARVRTVANRIGSVRLARLVEQNDGGADHWLTQREIEVLRLVANGLSNKEIGNHLFISRNTVANHIRNILTKTGCTNRTQASRYAVDNGLID